MVESAFEKLVAHARATHVVVVGGGIGGLVAALECAKVGMRVTVLEASERLGGTIADADIGGTAVALGPTGWSTAGGAVDALIDELGLGAQVVAPQDSTVWVATAGGVWRYPDETVAGIAANPWDPQVRRIIGWRGTWRAYLDRLRPPLTIGQQRSLGVLVRSRMGEPVHDQLVAPLTRGRYGVTPEQVDVARVAAGLNTALTRTGSLAGAAAERLATASSEESAPPPIRSLAGGMTVLVDAIAQRLRDFAVDIRLRTPVRSLQRGAAWEVLVDRAEDAAEDADVAGASPETPLLADAVIVATGAAEALRLAPLTPPAPLARELVQDVVTLVVDAPDPVESHTTVFTTDAARRPVVASDETARWGRETAGRRVLRLTYGDLDTPSPIADRDDDESVAHAVDDARDLLLPGLASTAVVGARRDRWVQPPPAVMLGREDDVEALRRDIQSIDGLGVVGAWIAGPGLARVVTGAREEAERVRVNLLWEVHADGVTLGHDHPLGKREETP